MDDQPRDPKHWRNRIEQEQQQKREEAEKRAAEPDKTHAERIRSQMPHNLRSEHTSNVDYVLNRDKPKQQEQDQTQSQSPEKRGNVFERYGLSNDRIQATKEQSHEHQGTQSLSARQENSLNKAKDEASVFDRYGSHSQRNSEKSQEQEKTKQKDRDEPER